VRGSAGWDRRSPTSATGWAPAAPRPVGRATARTGGLTGYIVINADDLDAAIELASGCPGPAHDVSAEVAEVAEVGEVGEVAVS
jgi:hypothetical protein